MTVCVTGDVRAADAVAALERGLGKLQSKKVPSKSTPSAPTTTDEGPRVILVDWPGDTQAHMAFAWVGPTMDVAELPAIRVATQALQTRLFKRLREELGITYGVHLREPLARGPLPFEIVSSVELAGVVKAIDETTAILQDLSTKPLPKDSLGEARTARLTHVTASFEGIAESVSALAVLGMHGLASDWYEKWAARLGAVTAESAQTSLAEHLPLSRMQLVIVGDAKVLEPQLRGFASEKGWQVEIKPRVRLGM